jgi:hypothetical protein
VRRPPRVLPTRRASPAAPAIAPHPPAPRVLTRCAVRAWTLWRRQTRRCSSVWSALPRSRPTLRSAVRPARGCWRRRASAERVRATAARSPQSHRASRAPRGHTAAIWRSRIGVARALLRAIATLRSCRAR